MIEIKMDLEKKKRLFTWMYIIMIGVVIATCIYLVYWLNQEATLCLKDPIEFYMNKAGELCYCNIGRG